MAQETFYFPHDYDPLQDIRMEAFVSKHGAVGYGVFWRLVELLHMDSDHRLPFKTYIYESVANKFKIKADIVEKIIEDCINEYCLFEADGILFWSRRVFKNIEKRKKISEQRSLAGRISAEQRKKNKEFTGNYDYQISTPVEQPSTVVEQPSTKKERKKENIIYS